jgi:rare lipoprotein A
MSTCRRHMPRRRAGALPVLFVLLLLVPAAPAGAQATGGIEAVPSTLDVRPASLAERTLRIAGEVGAEHAGRAVSIERQLIDGSWQQVATAVADAEGAFVATWRTDVPGRYALRATVVRDGATAEAASASDLLARVSVFAPATASWYGPGFFGRRTACGTKLTRRTVGVAHRKLPCGTQVEIYHRNRTLVVPVIDRGPFVAGRQWDLTQAAARSLGMTATSRIGVLPVVAAAR